jgi:hypothetical protein
MSRLVDICGAGLLLGIFINLLAHHGTWWTLGPHGMPVSLVAEDGLHYLDGEPLDPVTLWMVQNDCEEEVWAGLFSFYAIMLLYIFVKIRRAVNSIQESRRNVLAARRMYLGEEP